MSVSLSLGITRVHQSLSNTSKMASKRVGLKDTIESTTKYVVKQTSKSLSIYEDTELFIEKEVKMKWKDINDILLGTSEENLEDRRVNINIHKFTCTELHAGIPHFHAKT